MATIELNIRDGFSGRETLDDHGNPVKEVYRSALVSGLTGNAAEKLEEAWDALDSANCTMLSVHPNISDLYLLERAPEAVGTNAVRVQLVYRQRPSMTNGSISMEGQAACIETSINKGFISVNGANTTNTATEIYVSYTPTGGNATNQGGFVKAMLPQLTKTYSRTENTNPTANARAFVGKINNTGWECDPTANAYTWLCTGMAWRSQDAGNTYAVTYTFQYREDMWFDTCVYLDPTTGRPPATPVPTSNNGVTLVSVYTPAYFNTMNLGNG